MLARMQEGDWSARQQSQDGSEVHAADGYLHSVVPAHDIDPDGDTNSDGEEAEPAHQSAATGAAIQANGIAHQYTNGHAQEPLEVQLRHSDSSESEEEEDDDGQDEEGHGADTMQVQCTPTLIYMFNTSEYTSFVPCHLHVRWVSHGSALDVATSLPLCMVCDTVPTVSDTDLSCSWVSCICV